MKMNRVCQKARWRKGQRITAWEKRSLTIKIHSKRYSILVWHLNIWLTNKCPELFSNEEKGKK